MSRMLPTIQRLINQERRRAEYNKGMAIKEILTFTLFGQSNLGIAYVPIGHSDILAAVMVLDINLGKIARIVAHEVLLR